MRKTMLGNTQDVSVCVSCKFENSKLVFETRLWGSGGETGKLMRQRIDHPESSE